MKIICQWLISEKKVFHEEKNVHIIKCAFHKIHTKENI